MAVVQVTVAATRAIVALKTAANLCEQRNIRATPPTPTQRPFTDASKRQPREHLLCVGIGRRRSFRGARATSNSWNRRRLELSNSLFLLSNSRVGFSDEPLRDGGRERQKELVHGAYQIGAFCMAWDQL